VDGDRITDGGVVVAIELAGHGADDVGDLGVSEGVLIIEETASFDLETANVFVFRTHAQEHGVLALAATDGYAVVELEHGGTVANAGNLFVDGQHVFEGHVVGRADVVGAHNDATGVLHLDFVGAEAGDSVNGILLAGKADCGHENNGRGADDHAEHGEKKTGLAGTKAIVGKVDGFAEGDGGASAEERGFEGIADSHRC
jgi:hypothetical protein